MMMMILFIIYVKEENSVHVFVVLCCAVGFTGNKTTLSKIEPQTNLRQFVCGCSAVALRLLCGCWLLCGSVKTAEQPQSNRRQIV